MRLGVQAVLEIKPLMNVTLATKADIDHEEDLKQGVEDWLQAWDDVSGAELDASMVSQARLKEVEYLRKKPVYVKIPRAEAKKRAGRSLARNGST